MPHKKTRQPQGRRVKSTGRLHVWETLGQSPNLTPQGPDDVRLAPDMLYIGHNQKFLSVKTVMLPAPRQRRVTSRRQPRQILGNYGLKLLRSEMLFTRKSRNTDTRLLFRSSSG
jgi:hypothetical protein